MHPAGRCVSSAREHRVAALPVRLGEGLDLAPPVVSARYARHQHLGEARRAQHGRLGGQHQPLAHRGRRQRPAHPQPGGERLGERAEVDHVAVQRAQRRVARPGEAEQAVRVVLDHGHPVRRRRSPAPRPGARRPASRRPGCGSSGSCRGTWGPAPRGQRARSASRSSSGTSPCRPSRRARPGLVRREAAQRTDVRRPLGEHDVARVAEDPGDQVERHLRADRDHHVVRVGPDPLQRPSPRRSARAAPVALRGAVLQRHLTRRAPPGRPPRRPARPAAARPGSACRRPATPPRAGWPPRTARGSPRRVIPAVRAANRSVGVDRSRGARAPPGRADGGRPAQLVELGRAVRHGPDRARVDAVRV